MESQEVGDQGGLEVDEEVSAKPVSVPLIQSSSPEEVKIEKEGVGSELEFLIPLDRLFIRQHTDISPGFCGGCEHMNGYAVLDSDAKVLCGGTELSGCAKRLFCCGPHRPFLLILLTLGDHLIQLQRTNCSSNNKLEVFCPPGELLGWIKRKSCWWKTYFGVFNSEGKEVFRIRGPCCILQCQGEFSWKISQGEDKVGRVTKMNGMSALWQEYFTNDTNNLAVTFPPELDPALKTLLLGATVLIGFIYFDR